MMVKAIHEGDLGAVVEILQKNSTILMTEINPESHLQGGVDYVLLKNDISLFKVMRLPQAKLIWQIF